MVLRLPSLPRRQRSNKSSMTKIMAKPATPPTIPPTRSCVGGASLSPEPPFVLDEGGVVGAELPGVLFPPAPTTLALDITDASDA